MKNQMNKRGRKPLSMMRIKSLKKMRFDMGLTLEEMKFVTGLSITTLVKYTSDKKVLA